jgi:hypothetical protein
MQANRLSASPRVISASRSGVCLRELPRQAGMCTPLPRSTVFSTTASLATAS